MSGYSRDFDRVTIDSDGTTVLVEATSIDEDRGQPGSEDPATEIRVALLERPGFQRLAVCEPVKTPVGASWEARFPNAAPSLEGMSDVVVVGEALSPGEDPYVWTEVKSVLTRATPGDGT